MDLKKTASRTLKFLLYLSLGILILWLAFRNVAFEDIKEGLLSANYGWLALSLFFGVAAYFVRALRWRLLINPLGYKPSISNSFHAVVFGYLANIAIPRIGEVSKCVALGRKESIPVDKLFGTVLIERTIDTISVLAITVVFVFFANDSVIRFLIDSIYEPIRSSLGLTLGFWLLIGTFLILMILLVSFRERLKRNRFIARILGFIKGIADGFVSITKMEKKWAFLFLTIMMWLFYTLMSWFVVFCLDTTSFLGLNDAVFILIIGSFGMMVPVQSGFGAFHYIVSKGLASVYGIAIEEGLIYALISHESQLLMVILLGSFSAYIMFGKKRTDQKS
jgi:uncharacterized protein (TIRG00374 family)